MKHILLTLILWACLAATADDGSRLWLRLPDVGQDARPEVVVSVDGQPDAQTQATISVAVGELQAHWQGLPVALRLGRDPRLPADAFRIAKLDDDSFSLAASSATGLLYGAYFMLRAQTMGDGCLCQTLHGPDRTLTEVPRTARRSVAISKAALLAKRSVALARALSAIGINEVVLPPRAYNKKVEALADSLRPYGIALSCADDPAATPLRLTAAASWTPDHLSLFDWYAAGRRLWQPDLPADRLAYEWLAQTFSDNPHFVVTMRDALLSTPDAGRTERILDAWQKVGAYVDAERYDAVRSHLQEQLETDNE